MKKHVYKCKTLTAKITQYRPICDEIRYKDYKVLGEFLEGEMGCGSFTFSIQNDPRSPVSKKKFKKRVRKVAEFFLEVNKAPLLITMNDFTYYMEL